MSPNVLGSEMGIRISSPFRSSGGRSKPLLLDGEHFATLREDVTLSNIGPGYYEHRDEWTPSSFVKYNKPRTKEGSPRHLAPMETINGKTYNSIGRNDKPWRNNIVQQPPRGKKSQGTENPFDTSEVDRKLDGPQRRIDMVRRDIDAVKDLPDYFR